MQAIRTVYRGPTNTRGSRIIATSYKARTVMPYDHALSAEDNHARAAELHAVKILGYHWRCVFGQLPDGSYAHILPEVR